MDYKDKYEEALSRAKTVLENAYEQETKTACGEIFPELKESEDERIREALVDLVSTVGEYYLKLDSRNKMLAYLEKQKDYILVPKSHLDPVGKDGEDGMKILEKQKVNTDGDFARGYDCGYQCCLNSHGAEWFEKQKESTIADIDFDGSDEQKLNDLEAYLEHSGLPLKTVNRVISWLEGLYEKQKEPEDKGKISDGYHTFNELYYYRMLYNAAFFNLLPKEWVHKSKRHHDGEECFECLGGGWFIVMANLPTGQISNHYELKDWDLFQIPEKDTADEWDGHTPQEAAERIHEYLLKEQKGQKPVDNTCGSCCDDGRFEIIAQAKKDIIEQTNIAENELSMELPLLDGILLRVWQVGWLNKKPAEWNERDKEYLNQAIETLKHEGYEILATALKSINPQQKVEWSEEDEKMLNKVLDSITYAFYDQGKEGEIEDDPAFLWLHRLHPQPKVEWSKEDQNNVNVLLSIIGEVREMRMQNTLVGPVETVERKRRFDKLEAWLKSLRPQPRWKPSDK